MCEKGYTHGSLLKEMGSTARLEIRMDLVPAKKRRGNMGGIPICRPLVARFAPRRASSTHLGAFGPGPCWSANFLFLFSFFSSLFFFFLFSVFLFLFRFCIFVQIRKLFIF
jgi:hypothetical protein